jgi:hypothetical protein
MRADLDQKRIRELFTYDPETGELNWRSRPLSDFPDKRTWSVWNSRFSNKKAGHKNPRGYMTVTIDGRPSNYHRLIWMYVYGEWPDVIDHINGVHDDNRLINLRNISQAENARNRPLSKKSTTGISGVSVRGSKWIVHIGIDNTVRHVGSFNTREEALAARKAAEAKHGFHVNHGRIAA